MSFTKLTLKHGGGELTVRANEDMIALEGASMFVARLPVSARTETFSNWSGDKAKHELVLEVMGSSMHARLLRIGIREKQEPDPKNLIAPALEITESACLDFEIKDGKLIVTAEKPYDPERPADKFVLLCVPLESLVPAK